MYLSTFFGENSGVESTKHLDIGFWSPVFVVLLLVIERYSAVHFVLNKVHSAFISVEYYFDYVVVFEPLRVILLPDGSRINQVAFSVDCD